MLTGFRFDEQGKAQALTRDQVGSLPRRPAERVWIDIQGTDLVDLSVLSMVFQFHPLAIDDCLKTLHHPKIDEFEDHIFIIFRALDFDQGQEKFRTMKLACFLGESFLVTFHRSRLKSLEQVRERCLKDPRFGQRGPDFLLHGVLEHMVNLYFPEIEEFERAVEGLQAKVLEKPDQKTLREILQYKRTILQIRRFAGPQREVLNRLSRGDFRYIRPANAIYFRDIYDHTFRISDAIDNQRDMLVTLMETHLSVTSNRLNEIMKVLALITTFLMPLTVITGIYGMNFDVMPELKWRYGYFLSLGLMALVAGGLYYWFRRKKWF